MFVRSVGAALLALAALAPVSAVAQQPMMKYYLTDAVGNVRVVVDANATVRERHDYLPFGEECTTGACASNPGVGAGQARKFTGKERDAETGLDYFGARYYRAGIARFMAVDPFYVLRDNLVEPQRWNKYSYGLNNPFRYVDPDGKWPTKVKQVHQASIDRVLGTTLSEEDRAALKAAQVSMDEDQSSAGSPTHAMRSPGQSVEEARAKANDFVRSEIEFAQKLDKAGARGSAMDHLGNAMHTLQDATSPEHDGFQLWDEKWNSTWSAKGRAHVQNEFYDPGPGSRLDKATRRTYEYFTGKREIPKDFFEDIK